MADLGAAALRDALAHVALGMGAGALLGAGLGGLLAATWWAWRAR